MSTEREEFLKQFENVKTHKELPDEQLIKKLALFLAKLVGNYENNHENESVDVNKGITSEFIAEFYSRLADRYDSIKKPDKVTDVTVLFCGYAEEIDSFLEKATSLQKLTVVDRKLYPSVLESIQKKTPAQMRKLEGNAFEQIANIPENSQDFVTIAGAEFLFTDKNTTYNDQEHGFAKGTLAAMHRMLIAQGVARILRPNGVVYAQNETSRAFSESPLFRPVPETANNPQFFQLISK